MMQNRKLLIGIFIYSYNKAFRHTVIRYINSRIENYNFYFRLLKYVKQINDYIFVIDFKSGGYSLDNYLFEFTDEILGSIKS